MLTWAMAWMMVRLGEVTGYLLVLGVFGDVLVTLLLLAGMHGLFKLFLTFGAMERDRERASRKGGNGTGADTA